MLAVSIFLSLGSYLALLYYLRRQPNSLGLPLAYLYALMLIHVPGAIAHWAAPNLYNTTQFVETGAFLAALGGAAFVAGVFAHNFFFPVDHNPLPGNDQDFARFCVLAGWALVFIISPIFQIASFGAVIQAGGAIWMLGVMLGLRHAYLTRNWFLFLIWLAALSLYPLITLVNAGFLSYGSTAAIIVLSAVLIPFRGFRLLCVFLAVGTVIASSAFVTYFQHRDRLRAAAWSEQNRDQRFDRVRDMVLDAQFIDLSNPKHLDAFDLRLNQNMFLGLAAERIQFGVVDPLYGDSLREGLIALVPRIIWPDKPVFGGSPKIVSEMTGLQLNQDTSFGIGQVMEFYINFGTPGVLVGFFLLGLGLRFLDHRAMALCARGIPIESLKYFLPAVALIQPNGSIVELAGGTASAVLASIAWKFVFRSLRRTVPVRTPQTVAQPFS